MSDKNKIRELQSKIAELVSTKTELENQLLDAVTDAIMEISDENPDGVERIGDNAFSVKSSVLVDGPWTPSVYDWKYCGAAIMDWLANKPASDYKELLTAKLTENPNATTVKIKTSTDLVIISKEFIRKIIDRL